MRALAVTAVAVTALCSCGSPPRPAPIAARPDAPAPPPPPPTEDVLAALGVTGADHAAALAEVPAAQARAVAIAFLRAGRFGCARTVGDPDDMCGGEPFAFAPLPAAATLDDPCLRREVALWALGELEATDAAAVADALAAIVALPRPEQALIDEVVALVPPGDDPLRLRLIAAAAEAGRDDAADALLAGLSPGGAATALVELGRDAALEHLGATPAVGTLAAALDAGLRRDTALAILERLDAADLADATVAAAVRRTAGADDCAVAAAAAVLLDDSGDDQHLPRRMPVITAADATRALCVATHVSALEALAVLKPLVARDGFELRTIERDVWGMGDDEPDGDLDGDGDPRTTGSRTHVGRADLDADTLVEWLPTACDGGTCTTGRSAVHLVFDRSPGGGLYLDAITLESDNDSGCGC